MDRKKMLAFIEAVQVLRNSATDEQALSALAAYPEWKSNQNYISGSRVMYNGILYKILTDHTSQVDWTPDVAVSLFAKVLIPNTDIIPAWEQPDSTNPYKMGDKVIHNNVTWISTLDNNVWEPGFYGWNEITD